MISTYYKYIGFLFQHVRSRFNQVVKIRKKTKQLQKAIHRSGICRALWVLNYIEDVLGGYESFRCRLPVDKSKNPFPWYTYPAIEYLQQLDFSMCHVFEYGSGNGSKFWAQQARTVISVESDPKWYESGVQNLLINQKLFLKTGKVEYINSIHCHDSCFDVIVIDGRYRFNCAVESVKRIKSGGLLLLDNSDWYPKTAKCLRDAGYNQVDFIGAGPVNSYAWCTSLFFQGRLSIPRRCDEKPVHVQGGLIQTAEEDVVCQ